MKKEFSLKDLHLEGAAKWIHRFVMFITYPFRHFFVFLMLVLTLVAIVIAFPLFKGVPFGNIPEFYGQKLGIIEPIKHSKIEAAPKQIKAAKFKKEIKLKHAEFSPADTKLVENREASEAESASESAPEKYAIWKIKNKPISKKGEIKAAVKVVEPQEAPAPQVEEAVIPAQITSEEQIPTVAAQEEKIQEQLPAQEAILPDLSYTKREDLPLTYRKTPERISGEVIIYTANELSVDDTYLYLYGIYTNPNYYDEAKARAYLRKLIAGKKVECYIVAETKEGIGTALCFADGISINKSMVDAYFADNIAL